MTTSEAVRVQADVQPAELLSLQRQAFLRAGAPTLGQRKADIKKLMEAVKKEAGAIAAAISADFGSRSRHETLLADVWPVLASARYTLRHLSLWMKPKRVPVGLELLPASARILYQPLGVVGIISPWNYPFNLAIVPLIAALAAGNRVMLKPSELTPRTSEFMATFLGKLFPADKIATVLGGPETGAAFAALPFDHLFYTGSTAVGRQVMLAAAQNLTPVTLELGGKSPCIVAPDAPLASAAESIASGKLLNAGQTCIAPDYVLVPQQRREALIGHLQDAIGKFYPSLSANPDYTAIINGRHYARIAGYIEEARQRGARIVEINPSNEALSAEGRKIAPTLLIDPPDDLAVMRDEIFGPDSAYRLLWLARRSHRLCQCPPAPARPLLFRAGQGQPGEGAVADRFRRRHGQRYALACRRGGPAVRRRGPLGARRLPRRVRVSDLLAPQERVPAEPHQRHRPTAPALRTARRPHAQVHAGAVRPLTRPGY